MDLKPSHLGSLEMPGGIAGTDSASIGAIGGITDSFTGSF
jgi:hypothetical protein